MTFLDIASQAVQTALLLAVPVLALSLVVGFLISVFQAVTSIQEQTMTFVPKIFITGLALILFGPFMYRVMQAFATNIFGGLQNFVK